MRGLYPVVEPFEDGFLDVGDGHRIYWEISGNPAGKPIVFMHGGPGAASKPEYRRLFSPNHYRIILFDQRNCGRSLPHASEPGVDLATNTTRHLVDDIERLREFLSIDRWMVAGGSWGVALALVYAQTYPQRVTEMILRGVFTARREELHWAYQEGASWLFPDHWQEFVRVIPEAERDDLLRAYNARLNDADPAVRVSAAVAWGRWEGTILTLLRNPDVVGAFTQDEYAAAVARIESHYFVNGAFLEEGQLIRDAGKLAGIPCVIIQGRYDAICPARTAWELSQAYPGSVLRIVDTAGHAYDEPGILHEIIMAGDRFGGVGSPSRAPSAAGGWGPAEG